MSPDISICPLGGKAVPFENGYQGVTLGVEAAALDCLGFIPALSLWAARPRAGRPLNFSGSLVLPLWRRVGSRR